jgi:hypothetical protein
MTGDLYAETIGLLRDVMEKHDIAGRTAGRPIDRTRREPDRPLLEVLREHWEEQDNLAVLQRKIEDVMLIALDRLAWNFDYATAAEAVAEVGGGRFVEVILRRAIETLPTDDDG